MGAWIGRAFAEEGTDSHRTMDYLGLPGVEFTSPSLARAGMTEADALAAGDACDCRVIELADVPRAIVNRDTRGAVKLEIDADTRKVLGVHAVADNAGELMLAATHATPAAQPIRAAVFAILRQGRPALWSRLRSTRG